VNTSMMDDRGAPRQRAQNIAGLERPFADPLRLVDIGLVDTDLVDTDLVDTDDDEENEFE
jgi:hypothetical protein